MQRQKHHANPVAMALTRGNGQIRQANRYMETLFGYSGNELVDVSFFDLIHMDDRHRYGRLCEASLDGTLEQQEDSGVEALGLRRDGSEIRILINALALETPEGPLFVHAVRELSDRMAAGDSTRNSMHSHIEGTTAANEVSRHPRNELETILNNVPTYIFYKDTNNTILRANKAAADSLGVTPDEMKGRPSRQFYPEHANRYYADDLEVIQSGRPKMGIVEPLKVSHNQIRWIETSKIPIRNDSGEVTGILVLGSDITERKLAEQALRKAKDEAEQANTAKSRFLAAASHDLRQPLQAISLLTASLSKKLDDPRTQENLHELKGAVIAMRDLLDTYLDISKLDSGIIQPEITDCRIETLFNSIRLHFQRQAKENGIILRVIPSTAMVRSDPTLLEQLVRNFVDNAIRCTPSGKVLLGCRLHRSSVCIEVWDTGVGIPGDQLERIFEDFYQLDNPARNRCKGLGLGLAISKRVANQLNHKIDVRSWLDKGSCFSIEVPVAHGSGKPRDKRESRPSMAHRENLQVLLVDDDPAVLNSTRLFLEVCGFRVDTATCGPDALARMSSNPNQPDIIVADYLLPQGDTGDRVIQKVRHKAGREIPAILLTGDVAQMQPNHPGLNRCRFLFKPVDPEDLVRLINQSC